MRPLPALLAFLIACGGTPPRERLPDEVQAHSQLAEEDRYVPAYGKADLQKALIAERALEATGERRHPGTV